MITREPRQGDTIEMLPLWGTWEPWGTVSRVDGSTVYCGAQPPFEWCWGFGGCLGTNRGFRISESPGMEDPAFN